MLRKNAAIIIIVLLAIAMIVCVILIFNKRIEALEKNRKADQSTGY